MITRFCVFWLAAAWLAGTSGAAQPRSLGAAVTLDGVPDSAAPARERLADYLQARPASVLGFSARGQLLIRSRFGDTEQLHLVAAAEGVRRQLTFGRDPVATAAFSPDPAHDAFVYVQGRVGDSGGQLYYRRLADAGARLLSDAVSADFAPVWSSSGHEVAFTSAAGGPGHDIMVVDPESGALPHLVVAGDGADWRALDWAPDDHLLLVLKTVSPGESHLYLVDLASGQRRELDPSATPASIRDARLARDGQGVYYLSDAYGEFSQLRYINIFSGQKTSMSENIHADAGELALSADGRYLAFTSNEGGSDRLNLVDLVAHLDLTPPRLPVAGVVRGLRFDADGKRLAFSLAAPTQPDDAFVLDIGANGLAAWTRSETGPVDTGQFVAPRLVQVATFDHDGAHAREIPTFVYAPRAAGRHPVLLALESGPERQFRPGFDPWIQYLVNELGFAVVAPNLRGSPGYGRSYAAAGEGLLREDAIKDIGALLVWIRAQRDLDAQRIVVSGRGYGATLALATVVNYSDRVRGAVALSGISDLVEWLGRAAGATQARRRAQFGDERDLQTRAALRRLSPLTNVERINRPLLIAHGRNDPDVPIEQSDALVAAVRSHNVPVWYLVANEGGKDLDSKPARDEFLQTFAQFLASLP